MNQFSILVVFGNTNKEHLFFHTVDVILQSDYFTCGSLVLFTERFLEQWVSPHFCNHYCLLKEKSVYLEYDRSEIWARCKRFFKLTSSEATEDDQSIQESLAQAPLIKI